MGPQRNRGTSQDQMAASERVKALESAVRSLQAQNERLRVELVEERRRVDALNREVFHDPLTGLMSRAYLMDAIERSLHKTIRRPPYCAALLFIDLDKFKAINDSLGHGTGDFVLAEVGRRLQGSCRPQDIVGRLGGDEFVVLLDDLQQFDQASTVAHRILERLKQPIEVRSRAIRVGVSIGGSRFLPQHTRAEDVLHDADMAMYRAKRLGGARYVALHEVRHEDVDGQLAS